MLNLLGCLLIGRDLVNKIETCPNKFGNLFGFVNYYIAGAYAADIGNDKPDISKTFKIILSHRCYREIKDELFYWVKVDKQLVSDIERQVFLECNGLIEKIPQELRELVTHADRGYLLLLTEGENNAIALRIATGNENKLTFLSDLQLLDNKPDPFNRINGLVPLRELQNKGVAVIGLGSGGSFIAMELAACGIGELYLVDNDRLCVENLFRHICDQRDLGRFKTEAVQDKIKDHLLPVKIETCTSNILYSINDIREIVKKADVVVCATDTPQSRAMVNYICVLLNKPLILVCTYDNATIGEIIKVEPGKSACYECTRLHLKKVLIEDQSNREEVVPYSTQASENDDASLGTRTDVVLVASIAARVALMTLTEGFTTGLGELDFNYITWGSTRNIKFSEPFHFNIPFSTKFMNIGVHPQCPICGDTPDELRTICIEDKYNEILQMLEA